MPGPWSRTVSSPSRSRTSTAAAGRAPLGRVVEQVGDRAVEPRPLAGHHARLQVDGEADLRRVAACALDRGRHELVEPQRLGWVARDLAVAGELDEVADQLAELLELGDEVAPQALAVGGRQVAAGAEHLEVGAQRRERRAQLVRRVGDELALGALRVVERLEHRVERRGQPRELVVALRLDAARQVARAGDVLGGLGQLGDRSHGVAGGEAAEERRQRDAAEREQPEAEPQPRERRVDLAHRPRELDRGAVRRARA